MLFDLASVSSKSKTRIFLTGAFGLLALFKALSAVPKSVITLSIGTKPSYFNELGDKPLFSLLDSLALPSANGINKSIDFLTSNSGFDKPSIICWFCIADACYC